MCADEERARIVEALRSDRQVVEDAVWLAGRPLVHEDEHRIYVHAGLRPGVALAEQRVFDLLWIREPFLRSRRSFGKLVVHGHTPTIGRNAGSCGEQSCRNRHRRICVGRAYGGDFGPNAKVEPIGLLADAVATLLYEESSISFKERLCGGMIFQVHRQVWDRRCRSFGQPEAQADRARSGEALQQDQRV